MLVIFNKPFGVICQFSGQDRTLKDWIDIPDIYPAGRLDKDSEGLVLLTDDGGLQDRLAHPRHGGRKTYLVQVDGTIPSDATQQLIQGVQLKDGLARAIACEPIAAPEIADREPPIRVRKNIPTSWVEITLSEGRNRQVRRMTAAVGYPTLRLIRIQSGPYILDGLNPGEYRVIEATRVNSSHARHTSPRHRRNVRRR